ncbi:MAG: hypothetical protein Q7T78_02870 [Rhodoferax sp.]|nr:hypothetical protein [Rhodoferax sp.]
MKIHSYIAILLLAAFSTLFAATSTLAQTPADPHTVDTVKAGDFPAIGKSYNVDFGTQKFRLDFASETEMKFTSPDGKNTQVVPITITRISPAVFMVYWSRRAGQHVVHVEDFGNNVVYSNIFMPDGTAQRLKDTLIPLRNAD